MMKHLSLQQLETLRWIAKLGTFSAAADRLNTTQPAISNRIRDLERRLGMKLFEKQGRLATLTPAGRSIVTSLDRVFADLERSIYDVVGGGNLAGTVRIGAGEIAAANCLPAYCAQINRDMPDVSLEIDVALSAELLNGVLTARTDMVFLAGPVTHPALEIAGIGLADLLWVGSPAVVSAIREPARLEATTIWSLPKESPIHQAMIDNLAGQAMRARRLSVCSNVRLMIDIILQGGGLGLLPRSMLEQELASGLLVPAFPDGFCPPIPFYAAIRKNERDPLILNLFERAASLSIGTPPPTS